MYRICTLGNNLTNIRQKSIMNTEQKEYILAVIDQSTEDEILIKKTGWKEINLQEHTHKKFQIIYTLSGTLHVETEEVNYFVPEKHIAWIPANAKHKLSSKSRQVSLIIFYICLDIPLDDSKNRFSIYCTNAMIAENLKFIASRGDIISLKEQADLYNFTQSFFTLLPQMTPGADFLLKTLVIPNDSRLQPVLNYITEHLHEDLSMKQIAMHYHLSVRNLSRLFNASGIHYSSYVNHLRITRAIELLTDGDNTMQEIAYKVGFNTPNNFNRVFKQITGKSPKAYISGT